MLINIKLIVDEDNEYIDRDHPMGITQEAYEKLTGYPSPLSWLGEIEQIFSVNDDEDLETKIIRRKKPEKKKNV